MNQENDIIAAPDIFEEDYVPEQLPGREAHLKEIQFCISPLLRNRKPINLFLYGRPGTGKTSAARLILNKLEKESRATGIYLNCWERGTLYSVLDKLVEELRILGAEKPDASLKLRRIERVAEKTPLVVVLDEIDQLSPKERNSILYNLGLLKNVCLICICNTRYFLFSLDGRIKSRLSPKQLAFSRYSADDLAYILTQRAELSLLPQAWSPRILKRIAELADGDVRVAIQTLKNAAYYAENEPSPKISENHVKRGWNDARVIKKTYLLNKLTDHHRILYKMIKKERETTSRKLWDCYLAYCELKKLKPIAPRTYSEYINKLRDLGLIRIDRARVKGKVRALKIAGD